MKTFAAVGYLHIWDSIAHIITNYRFCRLNNKIEAIVKDCNICYMT